MGQHSWHPQRIDAFGNTYITWLGQTTTIRHNSPRHVWTATSSDPFHDRPRRRMIISLAYFTPSLVSVSNPRKHALLWSSFTAWSLTFLTAWLSMALLCSCDAIHNISAYGSNTGFPQMRILRPQIENLIAEDVISSLKAGGFITDVDVDLSAGSQLSR